MINQIAFPGLGLNFQISKVAFHIFGIEIYNYAICIVCGVVVALLLCKYSKENFGIKFDDVLEIIIFAILWGIIGARIYYVLFKINYYIENINEIFYIRDGGLAIYGGLILGAYVVLKLCKKRKISPIDFFDYIIPFVAIAQCIGRWGNFFNIEAYGIDTNYFLRMGIFTINGYQEVHPAFLYESFASLIIFILLRIKQKSRRFRGEIFCCYLISYSAVRMCIETIRIDSLMFFGLRISQIISFIIFLVSLYIFIKKSKKSNSKIN